MYIDIYMLIFYDLSMKMFIFLAVAYNLISMEIRLYRQKIGLKSTYDMDL